MKRGDIITIALQGDYGKPRPAVIVQSDLFQIPSLTILPITSAYVDAPIVRISVEPSAQNNIQKTSYIMVDKTQTVPRKKVGPVCGHLDDRTMVAINRALAVFLGLG